MSEDEEEVDYELDEQTAAEIDREANRLQQTASSTSAHANSKEEEHELEQLKHNLNQMESEAEKLRDDNDAATSNEALQAHDGVEPENSDETDSRSIYVGNVDYSATPEELQEHFAESGTVNRVTILCDRFRNPKGYAYIEFAEEEAVEHAVLLNDSDLKGRQIKVVAKRTNKPGMKGGGKGKGKGKGFGKGRGGKGYGFHGKGYGPMYRPRGKGRGYRPY